jgi:CRP/FNR family cyclic AMP-dependent transcriptional regulator
MDVIRPGTPAESLYYLVEGSVAVLITDEHHRELTITHINRGEFIGEMGMFMPMEPRSVTVRTRTRCRVAQISYEQIQRLLDGELREHARGLLTAIGLQLAKRLRQTVRKVGDMAFLDVNGRIAGTLVELCHAPEAMIHPDGMQIRVTRKDLASMVGCSRETAGRVLKMMEETGQIAVEGKKTIVVYGAR